MHLEMFDELHNINDQYERGEDQSARDNLIMFLDQYQNWSPYEELVNHLVRSIGLYPYMRPESSSWTDRFAYERFKVEAGTSTPTVLHREQSRLLKELLTGDNLAVSAPTSFGKSFVIDAYISLTKPSTVMIIVPTLALTDETRRRLVRKFGDEYGVITSIEVPLREKNIYVFPQERALQFRDQVKSLDLLVVDEFYKSSILHDKDRAPALVAAIHLFGSRAKQQYYLAPNVDSLSQSTVVPNVRFVKFNYNTVVLKTTDYAESIGKDQAVKVEVLFEILLNSSMKTLVYCGTYTNIRVVSDEVLDRTYSRSDELLNSFADWLEKHYSPTWTLTKLLRRGVLIHNGALHRPVAQMVVHVYEISDSAVTLLSTSSIIEGVNLATEQIILFSNKIGHKRLTDFSFKNIVGRGGRMFKYFIGYAHILEKAPDDEQLTLTIDFLPDSSSLVVDESVHSDDATRAKLLSFKEAFAEVVGDEKASNLIEQKAVSSVQSTLVIAVSRAIAADVQSWASLKMLNSDHPQQWENILFKILYIDGFNIGASYGKVVNIAKSMNDSWTKSIPEILFDLSNSDVGIDEYFKIERLIQHKLPPVVELITSIYNELSGSQIATSKFSSGISRSFLPNYAFLLEEYGCPRMVTRMLIQKGLLSLDSLSDQPYLAVKRVGSIDLRTVASMQDVLPFTLIILEHFQLGLPIIKIEEGQ